MTEDTKKLELTQEKLLRHKKCIQTTLFYEKTLEKLSHLGFVRIRCLALGSPTEEFQSLYQLALLELLAENYNIAANKISLYDPVFTELDLRLFENSNYSVQPECGWDSSKTLFYLPHAPRDVIEILLNEKQPLWILGNDLSMTIGTLSSEVFLEKYPTLATIVHTQESLLATNCNFQVVTRRRKKRLNKIVYQAPELLYELEKMYFSRVEIFRLESPENALWKNSFSDLAFNHLLKKDCINDDHH